MDRRELLAAGLTGCAVAVIALCFFWPYDNQATILRTERKPVVLNGDTEAENVQEGIVRIPKEVVSDKLVLDAWAAREVWQVPEESRILLVPHHLVTAKQISSLFSSLPKNPSKIFLIAPDHFSQGRTTLTVGNNSFESSNGKTNVDQEAIERLKEVVPSLRVNKKPFEKEHGITGLIPFIVQRWPEVKLVPIIIRLDAMAEDRAALSAALAEELKNDPQAILLSSIDFSHYLPAEVADLHDELAKDVIQGLADREADRVELDSPGALAITLKVARELGLGKVTIHAHTNSLRILQAEIAQDSTSHFVASFAPGPIQSQKKTTLFFVGDMMFDRTVATRSAKDLSYPFTSIRGQEDRFFKGHDLVIGNFECPATTKRLPPVKEIDFACTPNVLPLLKQLGFDALSQANNHSLDQGRNGAEESRKNIGQSGIAVFGDQVHDDAKSSTIVLERRGKRIALIGFNTSDNPLDEKEAFTSIDEAKKAAEYVIVFMHWGEEYRTKPSQAQVKLAHRFIDSGVNAVIGAHPHWMESVEVYKGKPIAYSLGNFIFDQDWSKETQLGLTIGLVLDENGSGELHLFPIRIDQSRPVLLTGKQRKERLEVLASISDIALSPQIKKGVILLTK